MILRRTVLAVLLAMAGPRFMVAATLIVDPGCPIAGTGRSGTCSAASPADNPKRTIQDAVSVASGGDTIELRGVHPAHDGTCPGTDGRYEPTAGGAQNDVIHIFGKNLTIQPFHYQGPGTGERVYLEGAVRPSGGWTRCPDASTPPCAGVPSPGETWYATNTVGGSHVHDLLTADGGIAFRIPDAEGPAGLTNAHPGYNPKRCSAETWIPCDSDRFCPAGQPCLPTQTEVDVLPVDTNSDGNTDVILARFGTAGPGDARVFTSDNGTFFDLANFTSFLIRGFVFRGFRRQAISVAGDHAPGPLSGLAIVDNAFYYNVNQPADESDYGVSLQGVASATFENNVFAYTGSKGIDLEAAGHCSITASNRCYGKTGNHDPNALGQLCPDGEICVPEPTVIHIAGNWFHNCADRSVLGTGQSGVPGGAYFESGGGTSDSTGAGDYTGSRFEDNLIEQGFNAIDPLGRYHRFTGVHVGDNARGVTIRDNVFMDLDSSAIVLDPEPLRPPGAPDGVATSNDTAAYNNLFIRVCRARFEDDSVVRFKANPGTEIANTRFYNNTSVDAGCPLLTSDGSCDPGACEGNVFANNHARDGNADRPVVSYGIEGVFDGNNIHSTISAAERNRPLVEWQGADYGCSGAPDFVIPMSGRSDYCSPVEFVGEAENNFHVAENSSLIDRGVVIEGARREASINNTVAGARSLPDYSDNSPTVGTVDIGAEEYRIGNASFEIGVTGGWRIYYDECPFVDIASVSGIAHTGVRSLRIRSSVRGPMCGGIEFPMENMATDREYTATLWVYSPAGAGKRALYVNGVPCFAGTTAFWQKVSCRFKTSGTSDSLRIYVGRPSFGSSTYFVDDVNVY